MEIKKDIHVVQCHVLITKPDVPMSSVAEPFRIPSPLRSTPSDPKLPGLRRVLLDLVRLGSDPYSAALLVHHPQHPGHEHPQVKDFQESNPRYQVHCLETR